MVSANSLSTAEIQLIKGMLNLTPRLKDQQVLAYFSRPHRDLNHRLIGQIRKNQIFSSEVPAPEVATRAFMAAWEIAPYPDPHYFAPNWGRSIRSSKGQRFLFLDWWPVGQGLFSSGAIVMGNGPRFSWIYDCGTSSRECILDSALGDCQQRREDLGLSTLDLAVLSHFDKDHISGFSRLVGTMPIRMVLLPYLTLFQRLILAIQQGVAADDAIFEFYVDPVAYLTNLDGSAIGQIVFVPPSEPDDDPPAAPIEPGPDPEGLIELPLKFEGGDPPEGAEDEGYGQMIGRQVQYLRRGGTITIPPLWEFVSYNDARMLPNVTAAFKRGASSLVDDLLHSVSTRQSSLDKLKALYDKHFGTSSVRRNIISLFLYSGPLDQTASLLFHASTHATGLAAGTNRFAQMYTGDGSICAGQQFTDFSQHYTPGNRLQRAGILQVMHHGAKGNWHAGLGSSLRPEASIFSSDPGHRKYKHPHSPVLRDFWPFHPIQVDDSRGFHTIALF